MSSDSERSGRDGGPRHLRAVTDDDIFAFINDDGPRDGPADDDDDTPPVDNLTFALDHWHSLEQQLADDVRAVNDYYRAQLRGCLLGGFLRPTSLLQAIRSRLVR
jgi:hypothetical protein